VSLNALLLAAGINLSEEILMNRVTIYFLMLLVVAPSAMAQATFHGNLARTGVYESPGPKQLNGVKWAFKTEGPVLSSPAVAGGVVYFGSVDNNLYAVDQETGKQKWKFKTSRQVTSSPAVVDGVVYFTAFDGALYALAADTGAVKWRFSAEYERRFQANRLHGYPPGYQTIPDSWDLFTSSPAVFNGKVYFGSGDGNIYAVDTQTGTLQWKFATGDVVHASPAIANNTVYIGSWDSYLYALDAESGQERWRFKSGEDSFTHNQVGFQSSPAVVDGTVYVGCRDAHVYALDAMSGRKKWDYAANKSWVNSTPAVRDGMVYFGTSDSSRFQAVDAKTGRLRFTFDARAYIFSSPALAGDLAYIGDENGKLYAVDARSGKLAWEFQTESSKKNEHQYLKADGSFNAEVIYAPLFNDYQDMPLGVSRIFSVGAIFSSPVVDHGTVYFGSTDGFLYALQ
jgi:outer membrane protein assembly factor BamB